MRTPKLLQKAAQAARAHHRLVVAMGILVIALALLATSLVARTSRNGMADDVQQARGHLSAVSGQLGELLQPELIEPGQRDTVLSGIISGSESISSFITEAPSLPSGLKLRLGLGYFSTDAQTAAGARQDYSAALTQAKDLAAHHRQVLLALQQLIEYNPRADLAGEMSSAERNDRVAAAKDGIADILDGLSSLQPLSDADDLAGLTTTLQSLQQVADGFSTEPNIDAWVAAIEQSQSEIIENRQIFWSTALRDTQAQLSTANASLSHLERALR
jgi:hypothetical protein